MASLFFTNKDVQFPFCDLQHLEFHELGCLAITRHSRYDVEHDCWETAIWVVKEDVPRLKEMWQAYIEQRTANTKQVIND